MNYVAEITGGIGYHIMATSFIKWLNEKYPKSQITILSAYPELFEYNPRIHRNLHLGQPYLFEDYIKGNDFRQGYPYRMYEYYREENKMHVMELFPKAYGFNIYNKTPEHEIYLTKGEEMDGDVYNKQNGPLVTFQGFGGLPPGVSPNKDKVDSSQRDMNFEFSCKVVSILLREGLKVLQIRGPTEPVIPNTLQLGIPFRNLLPIVKYSLGHVGIDSSMMHGAAAMKKPQLIFWGGTHKDNLGYEGEGIFNVSNKYGMHCRPHIQLPDREAMFPYKDKNDGKEFEYTDEEIEKNVMSFVNYLKSQNVKNR